MPLGALRAPLSALARRAFVPAQTTLLTFGPNLWWDLSDLSTLWQDTARTVAVASDSDPIGGITDKSGTGSHGAQATAGARPLWKASQQNGLGGALLDGTNDLWTMSATLTYGTVFIVCNFTSAGNFPSYNGLLIGQNGAVGSDGLIQASGAGVTSFYSASYFNSFGTFLVNGVATLEFSPLTTTKIVEGVGTPISKTSLNVGNDPGTGGRFWKGNILEVVTYPTQLSSGNRATVRGLLQTKWGT